MDFFGKKRIFLDYASATPVLPEVKKAMEKFWSKDFFNASAIYQEGERIRQSVDEYRLRISRLLGVKKTDIIFTSGGTEANNLALFGVLEMVPHPHFIISAAEHSSIRKAAKEIIRRGGMVNVAQTDEKGHVHPDAVSKLIKPNTVLISVMLANNETGAIEPIANIGRIVRRVRKERGKKYPLLHTDASQAANYLDINLEKLNVDLMTLDSSKIYGPKGIGLLAVRPTSVLRPMIFGGGQEGGLRPGTENTALIAGFTAALEIACRDREQEVNRLRILKQNFISKLENLDQVRILSQMENTLPNIVAIELSLGILNELVVLAMDKEGFAVSGGSACLNLGGDPNESLIRFSFGRGTDKREVERAVHVFTQIINHDKIVS